MSYSGIILTKSTKTNSQSNYFSLHIIKSTKMSKIEKSKKLKIKSFYETIIISDFFFNILFDANKLNR